MTRHCHPGLDDRCRDKDGEIRRKNGNTRVDTLREIYGPASPLAFVVTPS